MLVDQSGQRLRNKSTHIWEDYHPSRREPKVSELESIVRQIVDDLVRSRSSPIRAKTIISEVIAALGGSDPKNYLWGTSLQKYEFEKVLGCSLWMVCQDHPETFEAIRDGVWQYHLK